MRLIRNLLLLFVIYCMYGATVHANTKLHVTLQQVANKQLLKLSSFNLDLRLLPGLNAVHKLLDSQLVLINIVGGMVLVEEFSQESRIPKTVNIIVRKLQNLADQGLLPDTSLLFYIGDVMTADERSAHLKQYGETITRMPILTWAVDRSILFLDNHLLFPSPRTFDYISDNTAYYMDSWANIRHAIAVANILHPKWSKKSNKIFWQGKVIDYYGGTTLNTLDSQRSRLALDLQLITDREQEAVLQLESDKLPDYSGSARPYLYQVRSKYILSTHHADNVDVELFTKLSSNAVLFKQGGGYEEWYYPLLQPDLHFIAVKEDLSDLQKQYDLIESNPQKAEQILQHTKQITEDYLNAEMVDEYIVYFINQYAQLVHIVN